MNPGPSARRDILKRMAAAAGAIGLPAAGTVRQGVAHAAGAPAYDPGARFDLVVTEVELRKNAAGRMLKARIYQPKGSGPFPTVLDLHGGAWNRKDRLAEEPMDRALASSGLLVVAVDMTLAPEAPYPACVQDANHAVRWLKANAATWNAVASMSVRRTEERQEGSTCSADRVAASPEAPRRGRRRLGGNALTGSAFS